MNNEEIRKKLEDMFIDWGFNYPELMIQRIISLMKVEHEKEEKKWLEDKDRFAGIISDLCTREARVIVENERLLKKKAEHEKEQEAINKVLVDEGISVPIEVQDNAQLVAWLISRIEYKKAKQEKERCIKNGNKLGQTNWSTYCNSTTNRNQCNKEYCIAWEDCVIRKLEQERQALSEKIDKIVDECLDKQKRLTRLWMNV